MTRLALATSVAQGALSLALLVAPGHAQAYKEATMTQVVAVTVFPGEIYQAPRSWAERAYPKLIYFNEVDKGGHFRSPAYQEILHLRTDHVVSDIILVDGVGPDHTPAKFAQQIRHLSEAVSP